MTKCSYIHIYQRKYSSQNNNVLNAQLIAREQAKTTTDYQRQFTDNNLQKISSLWPHWPTQIMQKKKSKIIIITKI